jgi:hypothetical protein
MDIAVSNAFCLVGYNIIIIIIIKSTQGRVVNPLRDLVAHQLGFASIAITRAYQLAGHGI